MQENSARRSNAERSKATRSALMAAARRLFVEKGYADTGTPEIVSLATVTRGALYHHFADKADLFRQVIEDEARAVATSIGSQSAERSSALDALMSGAEAYFAAMAVPGRVRLLLLDGPAVLGHATMARIDRQTGGRELRAGLAHALADKDQTALPLDALTEILSAAFDRAALAIADGAPADDFLRAFQMLIGGLLGSADNGRA